jgi:Zn-finger nucleic acid-binding protein
VLKESDFLGVIIDACPICNGAWLDEGELAAINYLEKDLIGPSQESKPGKCQCPDCGVVMEETWFAPDKKIAIDRCPQCRGIWLDTDELKGTLRAAYENKNK